MHIAFVIHITIYYILLKCFAFKITEKITNVKYKYI